MNLPLVSIIIPAYNAQDTIKETVACCLAQDYKNLEIIIVDDGSKDDTASFFEEFENQGVRCLSIQNAGASNARNVGFQNAKGLYIQYLDADDILHPEKISKQLAAMSKERSFLSFLLWNFFKNEIQEHQECIFNGLPYAQNTTGIGLLKSFGMNNWFMPVFCWLTHRSLIEQAGPWNTDLTNNDDAEFFTRVLLHTESVTCVDEVLGYYRKSDGDSLSKLNSNEKNISVFHSVALIKAHVLKHKDKELLSYPKRLFHKQFLMLRGPYPDDAIKAARAFDEIKAPTYLSRDTLLWMLVKIFGLYNGMRHHIKLKKFFKTIKP